MSFKSTVAGDPVIIAYWESKSGRWAVHLETFGEGGYGYQATNHSGGVLYADTDEEAIAEVQKKVDIGLFQPDANKTPMIRVPLRYDENGDARPDRSAA